MGEPERIGQVVEKVMGKLCGRKIQAIRMSWQDMVGSDVATHATPVSLRGGRLLVKVDSSTWLQHLSMKRGRILGELQRHPCGRDITDLRFRQ